MLKPWTLSLKKDTITAKAVSQIRCPEGHKKLEYTLQTKNPDFHSLVRTWDTFSEVMLAMKMEWCWEAEDLINQILPTTLSCIHSLMVYTDLFEYVIVGDRKVLLLRCFLFISQSWRRYNYWAVHGISDIS